MEEFAAAIAYNMHESNHSTYEKVLLRDVWILENEQLLISVHQIIFNSGEYVAWEVTVTHIVTRFPSSLGKCNHYFT